jgi:hypothetical protein
MVKKQKKQLKLKLKSSSYDKISKEDIKSFRPTHIKFNFSFLTTNNDFSFENPDFNEKHKAALLDRIYMLSREELVKILNYKKNIGLEFIEEDSFKRKVSYHEQFDKIEFRKSGTDKFAVFRLYPNNNPIPARVIGKLVKNIFYVMFIDLNHELYDG